ncbi:FadR/GntR family transcriptional regulator [Planosporangium mesophilum]|uniref:GntR family transcriptional regulator n=1 Tax=Planosporangium mesophilum TaxID=689768 RepID=A0A8J3WYW3_9ACTN|nr:FadR/GntR family transcriptional regulator [Planosporangium mesophilum]NJC81386.1 FadR family transcriptional regulator [Planosporangium mesophilum]GII20961.1 GntR family transcriptional regulator [Planosporangium mesophilum]
MAITDEAIERIKEMIVSGELRPGDRLPKEADLAGRLGLSRNSLREAVRALSLVRVLDVRQGDGTYVTSLQPELLLDAVSFLADFHRDDNLLHLLEVRRILEPAASAMAAQVMSDSAIEELGKVLEELHDDPDIDRLIAADLEFHRRIAAGSGNPVLASLIDNLSAPTVRARIWRGISQEGAAARTHEQHWAIFSAIRSRQPELARAWAAVHVAGVEEWLRQAV